MISPAEDRVIDRLLQRRDVDKLRAYVERLSDRSLAGGMRHLNQSELVEVFELLPPARGREVFLLLQDNVRAELLTGLPSPHSETLFAALDPDDRAWICHQVPEPILRPWLAALTPSARELTLRLMHYGPRSTGRVISPHVLSVGSSGSVELAAALLTPAGAGFPEPRPDRRAPPGPADARP